MQGLHRSFFFRPRLAESGARPWVGKKYQDLVQRTLPIRGRLTEAEVLQAIINAPSTWAAVPTASSPPSFSYGAAGNDTPDTSKLGGVAWKRYWFRGANGQIEGAGGGRTLLQRADFQSVQTQGPALGGGVNYNNNSGNSTEWWQGFQSLLRAGQDLVDIGDFSNWGWGFTLTGRGFAFTGQSYTDFVVYVEESGVLKRCPYQVFPRSDIYAYVDFGSTATRNILLVIEPDSWSSEVLIPTTATMVPWSGWRTNKLTCSFLTDSYFQSINTTDGCSLAEQVSLLMGGHPVPHASSQGGSGYSSDNSDSNVRPFQFAHRLNRFSTPQPDIGGIFGGINDGWPTSNIAGGGTSNTAQAIDRTLQTARFDNPSMLLVVGSPWSPNGPAGQTVGGKYQLINNYLQTVLSNLPGPWIFVDSLSGSWKTSKGTQRATAEGPWFTGTGNSGAPNGTGNADTYISPDGTHPNDAGRRYISEKTSQYMHEAAASMVFSYVAADQVLAAVSQSAAAASVAGDLSAAAAQSLGAVSQTSSAAVAGAAAASQALAPVSATTTAGAQAAASAGQTLAGVGQTAASAAQDRLSAAQALQGVGQATASGAVGSATAVQTLAAVAQSGVAGVLAASAAVQVLAPVGQSSTASAVAGAASSTALAGVGQAATGVSVVSATSTRTLQGVSQSAGAGVVPSGIVATQTLAGVSQASSAAARASAAAAQALVSVVNSAAAAAVEALQAAQQLDGVTQEATGEKPAQVAAAQILEAVEQTAAAQRLDVRAVSGAQALANVVQLAMAQPGGAPEPVYGGLPPGRQRTYPSRPTVASASRPANVQGRSW